MLPVKALFSVNFCCSKELTKLGHGTTIECFHHTKSLQYKLESSSTAPLDPCNIKHLRKINSNKPVSFPISEGISPLRSLLPMKCYCGEELTNISPRNNYRKLPLHHWIPAISNTYLNKEDSIQSIPQVARGCFQ